MHPGRALLVGASIGILAGGVVLSACSIGPVHEPTVVPTPNTSAMYSAAASGAPVGNATTTVDVVESEYYINPNTTTVPSGTVTFVVHNEGNKIHEFVIVPTTLDATNLPLGPAGLQVNEDKVQFLDTIEAIPPGTTQTLTVKMAPGHYVLICNKPDYHYTQGMHTNFTVTG